jgi:hypothetical protein
MPLALFEGFNIDSIKKVREFLNKFKEREGKQW